MALMLQQARVATEHMGTFRMVERSSPSRACDKLILVHMAMIWLPGQLSGWAASSASQPASFCFARRALTVPPLARYVSLRCAFASLQRPQLQH